MNKKKKLIIIDQSFKDYTGHHYNYNKYLYNKLNKNLDISFYVNEKVLKQIKNSFNKNFFNIFKETSYSVNYKIPFLNKIKKFKIFRHLFFFISKYYFTNIYLLKFIRPKIFMSDFYNKLFFLYKNNKNSIFFLHSLSESEFLETLFFLHNNNNNNNNNNKIYIVYRRDPRFLKNFFLVINKLIDNKYAYLLTDSFKIKNYLENEINKKIYLVNIPINFNYNEKKKFVNKKKKKFIVSYLGDARLEKGFFELPFLLKKKNFNKKFQFRIQANSNGYDLNLYNKTISILKKIKNLNLLKKQLNEEEYVKILFNSDIILLPYRSEFYQYRTSSIFYEGIYAEKIIIVTANTWMSSFYEDNLILKKLILSDKNNLGKILNYIYENYNLLIKNIISLKKNILIKNNISLLKRLFKNSKKTNILVKKKVKYISYLLDENVINRRVDGNQLGTLNIIKNIFSNQFLFNKRFYFNILFNCKIDAKNFLFTINNLLRLFSLNDICFKYVHAVSSYFLKNNKLSYHLTLNEKNLFFKDIILLNFHFYINHLKKINYLKKIILVHDVYSQTNNQRQFLDDKNNHYIFMSYNEFSRINFLKAQKYLIYPISTHDFVNNNNLRKKFQKYNYIFISSGSDVDKTNLEIILKTINKPINIVGEICFKLNNNFLDLNFSNLILKGFVNNLEEYFNNPENVFLIPRYEGIGIPIKFLELLKFRSKAVLFGNANSFGLPNHLVEDFIYAENQHFSLEDFINRINYKKLYNNLISSIKSNNNHNKNKLLKNIKC